VRERIAALIAGAGAGRRFGASLPKVFVPFAGRPLLTWSLTAFALHPEIDELVVVVGPDYVDYAESVLEPFSSGKPLRIVGGGAERQQSVFQGLQALYSQSPPPDIVAIHDGARPLVSAEIISDSLRVCREYGAALAAWPITETVKRVHERCIVHTIEREGLFVAQTPQTFRFALIWEAHTRAAAEGWKATDDAMLVERLGHPVYVSRGEAQNVKITTPDDLTRAESWLLAPSCLYRVGQGFDVHRLTRGRKLVLGGVTIPHELGLQGHSDADVALHALMDALLGAGALGDIGQHFPDTDPQYQDADSKELLRHIVQRVRQEGWEPVNIDITIIAQAPKLAPHIHAMRVVTAETIGLPLEAVSYKAKTMEGLGAIGRGRAIAAEAVALVRKIS